MGDSLCPKINADWMDKGVCYQIGDRENEVDAGEARDVRVLL